MLYVDVARVRKEACFHDCLWVLFEVAIQGKNTNGKGFSPCGGETSKGMPCYWGTTSLVSGIWLPMVGGQGGRESS